MSRGRLLFMGGPLLGPNAPPLPHRQHPRRALLLLPPVSGRSVARQPLMPGMSPVVIALPPPLATLAIVPAPKQVGPAETIAAPGRIISVPTAVKPSMGDSSI